MQTWRGRNLIQNPELNRKLQRFVGTQEASVAPTVSQEIAPVILVGDLTRENPYDVQFDLGAYDSVQLQLAADTGYWALLNPADSNISIEIVKAVLTSSVAQQFYVKLGPGILYGAAQNAGTARWVNLKRTPVDKTVGVLYSRTTSAGPGGTVWTGRIAANSFVDIQPPPAVLPPFTSWCVAAGVTTCDCYLSVWWRERALVA